MEIVAILGQVLNPLFTWFGNISANKGFDKQDEITEEQTQQVWYQTIFGFRASETAAAAARANQLALIIAVIVITLIIALVLISKKKK